MVQFADRMIELALLLFNPAILPRDSVRLLVELDAATLAVMRGDVERVNEPTGELQSRMRHAGAPSAAVAGAGRNHRRRQYSQQSLRRLMSTYGGLQRARGRSNSEAWRRFYFRYGVDVLTAQSLGRSEADSLACRLIGDLGGQA